MFAQGVQAARVEELTESLQDLATLLRRLRGRSTSFCSPEESTTSIR